MNFVDLFFFLSLRGRKFLDRLWVSEEFLLVCLNWLFLPLIRLITVKTSIFFFRRYASNHYLCKVIVHAPIDPFLTST